MNAAGELMERTNWWIHSFFIRHDHHDVKTKHYHWVLVNRFSLACYFHLLASVFRQWRQNNWESFWQPRHGSLSPFYTGFEKCSMQCLVGNMAYSDCISETEYCSIYLVSVIGKRGPKRNCNWERKQWENGTLFKKFANTITL